MKIPAITRAAFALTVFAGVATGCASRRSTGDSTALRSERDYAEQTEARAQDLVRTGRASNLQEARAQAAADANREWAAAATDAGRKEQQEAFEQDLDRMDRDKR